MDECKPLPYAPMPVQTTCSQGAAGEMRGEGSQKPKIGRFQYIASRTER